MKNFDGHQREIIALNRGRHLVLAPPGCGKTDILAERISKALSSGIKPEDILCLTFTNKAARGMLERIQERLADEAEGSSIFVGNVHRFCSKYIFENGVLPQSTCILDEDTVISIMQELCGDTECEVKEFERRSNYTQIANTEHFFLQCRHHHRKDLFLHKEDLSNKYVSMLANDLGYAFTPLTSWDEFCNLMDKMFQSMTDRSESELLSYLRGNHNQSQETSCLLAYALGVRRAREYEIYKQRMSAIDFDDLLIYTFNHARTNISRIHKYPWVQVDEVQDLNFLQHAIISTFTDDSREAVVVYLGDEQQAIFSFMGASVKTLDVLKSKCEGNIHHLYNNYRSPKYMLDMFNEYANMVLDMDPALLPASSNLCEKKPSDLTIRHADTNSDENKLICNIIHSFPDEETVAVLVPSNAKADELSSSFKSEGIGHFKVSGTDSFYQKQIRTMIAHIGVLKSENDISSWAELLSGLKVAQSGSQARRMVRQMRDGFVLPSDYLNYPSGSSCILAFKHACEGEFVIFDTETTGLDVFNDDIVQLAAVKVKDGEVIDKFNCFLHSEKPILKMLGNKENPLYTEYPKAVKRARKEALEDFLTFVGSAPLFAHNAEYDYHILDFNLRRDCNRNDLCTVIPTYFDSLKVIRMLRPELKSFKLESLLETLGLSGVNSHMADDDIMATLSLIKYCADFIESHLQEHKFVLEKFAAQGVLLRERYLDIYSSCRLTRYETHSALPSDNCALVEEMLKVYRRGLDLSLFGKAEKLDYIIRFLNTDIVHPEKEATLHHQIEAHAKDLGTFREADICSGESICERVFISTVHKAKGLEFDNVIITGAVDGTYPFYLSKTAAAIKEDARKFYVALTRAKRRICISWYKKQEGYSRAGNYYSMTRQQSPFLDKIKKYFA